MCAKPFHAELVVFGGAEEGRDVRVEEGWRREDEFIYFMAEFWGEAGEEVAF